MADPRRLRLFTATSYDDRARIGVAVVEIRGTPTEFRERILIGQSAEALVPAVVQLVRIVMAETGRLCDVFPPTTAPR